MGVGIGASSASVHLEANSAITTVLQNLHGSGTCVYPKIQRGSRGAAKRSGYSILHYVYIDVHPNALQIALRWGPTGVCIQKCEKIYAIFI